MVNKQEKTESGSKLLDLPQQLTAGDLSGIMDVAPSAVIKELMRHDNCCFKLNKFVYISHYPVTH
jgi:hypothetical protein